VKGSSSVSAGRAAAFEALQSVQAGALLDAAFRTATRGLEGRERSWARECAFGVLRHRGRLDRILDSHLHKGLKSVEAPVLELLRLGAYQILRMDGVPAYAAVSQTVEQVRGLAGGRPTGLVNGVLRAVERGGEDVTLFADKTREPADFLASWHSHPRWLVERWLARWSAFEVEQLLEANNRVPPVYLRPLGITEEAARDALGPGARAAGKGSGCVQIPAGVTPVAALAAVRGIIQDPAAALVTRYAHVPSGWRVADLCAAPGGKAVVLAEDAAYVVAADRSLDRLGRLRETVERLGIRLGLVVADAAAPPLRMVRGVVLDVPCSGTGTLRRHPDLKWRLEPGDLASLVTLQRTILDGAAPLVPAGGLLVYSTCTLEPEENEEQVEAFLNQHPDFRLEATEAVAPELLDETGALRVLPHLTGFDGAYAARLRRVA